jgi:hypothetical protein
MVVVNEVPHNRRTPRFSTTRPSKAAWPDLNQTIALLLIGNEFSVVLEKQSAL